jgi:FdhD protein
MTAPAREFVANEGARSVACPARAFRYDIGVFGPEFAQPVAVETPVEICYGGQPFAVMMATPADLEDFAFGFSLTEGIVARREEVRSVEVRFEADSARVDIALAGEALHALLARRRALPGRTGCGVCGVEDLAHLPRALKVSAQLEIAPHAIGAAVAALDAHQPLNAATRAAHGAAWARAASGEILLVREDVGRHNALDKCIGALIRASEDVNDGFLLITSRCSHEMVVKASKLGASVLVSVSAPTTMALRQAEAAGVRLITVARADHATSFAASGGEAEP